MPRDGSAPPHLTDLIETDDLLEAATVAVSYAGYTTGAERAVVWLQAPGGNLEVRWTRDEGVVDSLPENEEQLAALGEAALEATGLVQAIHFGTAWMVHPLPGSSTPSGAIALAAPTPSRGELAAVCAALAAKVNELVAQENAARNRGRSADWFKTMDDQIRILEGERQKLAALVNTTDAAVFVADPDGHIVWANQVATRTYRRGGNTSILGDSCSVVCGTDSDTCTDCPVRTVREEARLVHQERIEERGGQAHHLYVSAFPVRAPEGHVNEILVMVQDLSDLETLRRSEERYHLLFERSADAIVMADPESFRIVMANRRAREFLGVDPKSGQDLLILHPADQREAMRSVYRGILERGALDQVEVDVLAADGPAHTCNAAGTTFDLDGKDVLLVEYRDVTQVRDLQQELARAEHLITLGTMNAGIAHEFKNRLAPLRAFAQLVGRQQSQMEKVLTRAPLMIEEIDRLTGLVRDVLDYARPQEPRLQDVDLTDWLRAFHAEYVEQHTEWLSDAGVTLTCCIPEDADGRAELDPEQLHRMLYNLLRNALDATTENGNIEIALEAGTGSVAIVVTDNGCGMDAATVARIYDPFYTTKGPRGTGLGMGITRSLVEAHGGELLVESRPGSGTTVRIRLPRRAARQAA